MSQATPTPEPAGSSEMSQAGETTNESLISTPLGEGGSSRSSLPRSGSGAHVVLRTLLASALQELAQDADFLLSPISRRDLERAVSTFLGECRLRGAASEGSLGNQSSRPHGARFKYGITQSPEALQKAAQARRQARRNRRPLGK